MTRFEAEVVVGSAGFIGRALIRHFVTMDKATVAVDRVQPSELAPGVGSARLDLLTDDLGSLPAGRVTLLAGDGNPRPVRPWTLALVNAVATARLAPSLHDREVVVTSSAEVYGWSEGPLREDTKPRLPWTEPELEAWCDRAESLATGPCPPWIAEDLCREVQEADPSGRWIYAMSKAAQEIILRRHVPEDRLTVLRLANVFGLGQERVVARIARSILAKRPITLTRRSVRSFLDLSCLLDVVADSRTGGTWNVAQFAVELGELARIVGVALGREPNINWIDPPDRDTCGVVDATPLAIMVDAAMAAELIGDYACSLRKPNPMFVPPVPVISPPRPERPAWVAATVQQAIWSGKLKSGNDYSRHFEAELRRLLRVGEDFTVVLTASGTAALGLAVRAVAGRGTGRPALLPSFTYPATAEVLVQLGYVPVFADVDAATWTLDPERVDESLRRDPTIALVVSVDALGNPADYAALREVCAAHGVALVSDSAAALGSAANGVPVGTQAHSHSFSMSFAKTVSAAGAGGIAIVPAAWADDPRENLLRVAPLSEVHGIIALDQLLNIETLMHRRRAIAAEYDALVARAPLSNQLVRNGDTHSYVHYVVRTAEGAAADLARRLQSLGVSTAPYFSPALHRSHWERDWHASGCPPLPVTESLAAAVVALPMSSELCIDDAQRVVMALEIALELGQW